MHSVSEQQRGGSPALLLGGRMPFVDRTNGRKAVGVVGAGLLDGERSARNTACVGRIPWAKSQGQRCIHSRTSRKHSGRERILNRYFRHFVIHRFWIFGDFCWFCKKNIQNMFGQFVISDNGSPTGIPYDYGEKIWKRNLINSVFIQDRWCIIIRGHFRQMTSTVFAKGMISVWSFQGNHRDNWQELSEHRRMAEEIVLFGRKSNQSSILRTYSQII